MGAATPPVGTVTVLLGDVEGSSALWERAGGAMQEVIRGIDELVDKHLTGTDGHRPREQGEGDNLVLVFSSANDAVAVAHGLAVAIDEAQWPVDLPIRMRFGLHSGEVTFDEGTGYLGSTFNRCARIREFGHGGQVLLSEVTRRLADAPLPDGATIVDHGRHELRGIGREEQVLELVRPGGSARPLRSTTTVANNVPATVSSLVGREEEIEQLRQLLVDHRLVTLSGPGGAGKTRLATEVAHSLVRDPSFEAIGGVWFVDLSSVLDVERVATTVGEVLGQQEVSGRRAPQLLAGLVDAKAMLLVLDNCEHLVDEVAELVELLTSRCPNLRVLATSREAFGIEGERVVRVRPLGVGTDGDAGLAGLDEHDATRLFVERAEAAGGAPLTDEDAAAVVEVCQRLDGIPLAIELAAARTKFLSAAEIASGLADRFHLLGSGSRRANARQRTLEASVAWSHDLLEDREREVFRRLAVFPGAFLLHAARHVGSLGEDDLAVVGVLEALVDKSLLVVRPSPIGTTFRLLETIRQYAADRLVEAGEVDAARGAHLDHLLEACWLGLENPMDGLTEDASLRGRALVDDVRAAIAWAPGAGRAADLVELLFRLYMVHSNFGGVRDVVEALVPIVEGGGLADGPRARALALLAAHLTSANVRHPAEEYATEAIELARRGADWEAERLAHMARSLITWWLGGPRSHAEDHLAFGGDDPLPAGACFFAGGALAFTGLTDPSDHGIELLQMSLDACRERDLEHGVGLTLAALAVPTSLRDVDAATQMVLEALAIARRVGHRALESVALFHGLGLSALYRGDMEALHDAVEQGFAAAGPPGTASFAMVEVLESHRRLHLGDLDGAEERLASAARLALARDNVMWRAWVETLQGEIAMLRGDLERARPLLERAMAQTSWDAFSFLHGMSRSGLGRVLFLQGHRDEALGTLREAVTARRSDGLRLFPAASWSAGVIVEFVAADQPEVAACIAGACEADDERTRTRPLPTWLGFREAGAARARELLGAGAFAEAVDRGRTMTLDEAVALA